MEPKPIVYIVEDDPAVIRSLMSFVEAFNFRAESYVSATEFLDAYEPAGPGCLIADVRLPGIDGLQLQQELAKSEITLPIIFITGHADARVAAGAMKAGAIDFLVKPFHSRDLCAAIHKAIGLDEENWRHRAQRDDDRADTASI